MFPHKYLSLYPHSQKPVRPMAYFLIGPVLRPFACTDVGMDEVQAPRGRLSGGEVSQLDVYSTIDECDRWPEQMIPRVLTEVCVRGVIRITAGSSEQSSGNWIGKPSREKE